MAEFKFSCPQCKQSIQCDAAYTGSEINCPACRQAIIVPPVPPTIAPAGEPAIYIRKSTLKKAGVILLGVLIATALVAVVLYVFASTRTLTFRAYVDGTDIIKLQGRKLWIEHLEWSNPNKIVIDGKKWTPSWDGNTSAPYYLSWMLRSVNPQKLKLTTRLGRGSVSILEKPAADNQQTLSIKVDDGPYGGADLYQFTVSW